MLTDHDTAIDELKDHAASVNTTLALLNESLKSITQSIEQSNERLDEVVKNVAELNQDFLVRNAYRNFFKAFGYYLPFLTFVAFLMMLIDFGNVGHMVKRIIT